MPVPGGTVTSPLGVEDLDRYLAHLILQANPDLPSLLSVASPESAAAAAGDSAEPLSPYALGDALLKIVQSLKTTEEAIVFASERLGLGLIEATGEHEEELDDVARVVATGKLNKFTSKTKKNNKASGTTTANGSDAAQPDTVEVPHPLSASLPAITIGPERHRYAEPLFEPSLLAEIPALFRRDGGSSSGERAYSQIELEKKAFSVPEAAPAAVRSLEPTRRILAWENVIITGEGALIKGEQRTLLLLEY
jgi:actin-related protein 9